MKINSEHSFTYILIYISGKIINIENQQKIYWAACNQAHAYRRLAFLHYYDSKPCIRGSNHQWLNYAGKKIFNTIVVSIKTSLYLTHHVTWEKLSCDERETESLSTSPQAILGCWVRLSLGLGKEEELHFPRNNFPYIDLYEKWYLVERDRYGPIFLSSQLHQTTDDFWRSPRLGFRVLQFHQLRVAE